MIRDFSKDLRPISLTSTLSKIAESIVFDTELKPVILKQVDPNQFGFIPGSSTTFHHWLNACDNLNTDVKLYSLSVKRTVVKWINRIFER